MQCSINRDKAICPHCGAVNSQAWIEHTAACRGVWLKCKKCKKEFEIKK